MAEPGRYALSERAFDDLAQRVSNWGRWGAEDEAGALNFITPEKRRQAASLVRDGVAVSCALDLPMTPAADNPRPGRHLVYRGKEAAYGTTGDFLTLEPHGWSLTHLDALCHVYYKGRLYNDRPVDDVVPAGAPANSIMSGRDGIVSRGVLIDLPKAMGRPWMDPGDRASLADVRRALDLASLEVDRGDVLLVRTGRFCRNAALGTQAPSEGLAGLSVECAEWVHASEVAGIICDGGTDPQPSEVDGVRIPWHVLTLTMMGLQIVDNADLEAVADTCERLHRWEFQLVMAPWRLRGGTSSPINPIAIF